MHSRSLRCMHVAHVGHAERLTVCKVNLALMPSPKNEFTAKPSIALVLISTADLSDACMWLT